MHPYLLEALARERVTDLRRGASEQRTRPGVQRLSQRRERIGWLLVAVGLRLVGDRSATHLPVRGIG